MTLSYLAVAAHLALLSGLVAGLIGVVIRMHRIQNDHIVWTSKIRDRLDRFAGRLDTLEEQVSEIDFVNDLKRDTKGCS